MKTACTLILCLAASLHLSSASAQVYQWKDSTGRTVISDSPPPATAKGSRTVSTNPPAGASASFAEKDMEFKKRQQDAKQKSEKDAKEQAAAAEKKENCERARGQLANLESGERLMVRDENGEKRFIDDTQRQRDIDQTRKFIAENCK